MTKGKYACVAVAALFSAAAPASAASFIGDDVIIRRVQGTDTVFKTVETSVGDGYEFSDNFFTIDISANAVNFDAISPFSVGSIRYEIRGLDFDDNPDTPNVIENFTFSDIFGTKLNPFGQSRVTIAPDGLLTMSFADTTGAASGFANIELGAPIQSAVPEPATWAMMISGFGLVGGTMRSRRRSGAAKLAAA